MTQPTIASHTPIEPRDSSGLFSKRKTYFGFLPVWNEGRHNARFGGLAQEDRSWRITGNQEVYDALATLHQPVVALPPGRAQAREELRKRRIDVHVLTDWQLNELVRQCGSDAEALAHGLLRAAFEQGGGDVAWI